MSIKCQAIVKGHGNLTSKEFRWSYIIIEYDKCPKYTILYVCMCQMDTETENNCIKKQCVKTRPALNFG